jgi:hypothetical protein
VSSRVEISTASDSAAFACAALAFLLRCAAGIHAFQKSGGRAMLFPEIVAAALMFGASAVVSLDSPPAKLARYTFLRWQRRRRPRRSGA